MEEVGAVGAGGEAGKTLLGDELHVRHASGLPLSGSERGRGGGGGREGTMEGRSGVGVGCLAKLQQRDGWLGGKRGKGF